MIKDNWKVYGYDNYQTGIKENTINGVEYLDYMTCSHPKVDVIFHLGMPSTSPLYKQDRLNISEGVESTVGVFEHAIKHKAKVIYASSSSLYNGHKPPHREDMKPFNKDWYTEVRYFIERLAYRYWEYHKVQSVGLRLFSCYGNRDAGKKQYANVVTQFALDMINGKRPLLYGDGYQSRDFTHVDDVVEAFIRAVGVNGCDIINVGTGRAYSFNESVYLINEVLGTNLKPRYTNKQIHNYVFRTRADVRKMVRMLGFKPKQFTVAFPEYVRSLKDV